MQEDERQKFTNIITDEFIKNLPLEQQLELERLISVQEILEKEGEFVIVNESFEAIFQGSQTQCMKEWLLLNEIEKVSVYEIKDINLETEEFVLGNLIIE